MIVSTGTIINSTWGYYLTSSNITPTSSGTPTWNNNSGRWESWLSPTLAPNGHMYAAPGTATCVLKIKSGSLNSTSTNYTSTTIEFITASSAGGTLYLPGSNGTANVYEKFPSLVLASNGKMYAVDYSFLPSNTTNTTGYIIEVNPSNDTYITQSFQYPGAIAQRCLTNILGIDGYIYWMVNSPNNNNNFRLYRFDPNVFPFVVESSSLLSSAPLAAARTSYIGSLAPNGRIYFIPRALSSTTTYALCVSTSLFTPNTQNGITKVTLPTINSTTTAADLAYWTRGVGLDNCVYYSPRFSSYGGMGDTTNVKTLKLNPYGGIVGTGSFTLVGPQMSPNIISGNISQGYLKTLNGDLFAPPISSWNTSFSIIPSGSSPTVISSSFYPINMNNSNIRSSAPASFIDGKSILKQPIDSNPYNIFFYEFFSIKGNYSGVTNFSIKDTDLFTPPTPVTSISSSRYNWYSNFGV